MITSPPSTICYCTTSDALCQHFFAKEYLTEVQAPRKAQNAPHLIGAGTIYFAPRAIVQNMDFVSVVGSASIARPTLLCTTIQNAPCILQGAKVAPRACEGFDGRHFWHRAVARIFFRFALCEVQPFQTMASTLATLGETSLPPETAPLF